MLQEDANQEEEVRAPIAARQDQIIEENRYRRPDDKYVMGALFVLFLSTERKQKPKPTERVRNKTKPET